MEQCDPLPLGTLLQDAEGFIPVESCDVAPWPEVIEPDDESGDEGVAGSNADGEPCERDEECMGGSRCMPSLILPDGPRECAPPCEQETSAADCKALTDRDFYIEAPYEPNAWNSPSLSRGNLCGDDGFCQYVCPPNSALGYDDAGNPETCVCLPHFANVDNRCVWEESIECALLEKVGAPNPCDACNSDVIFDNCPTGRYECFIDGPVFDGYCVEWATEADLTACIEGGAGYDCDPVCYESCASASCSVDFCNIDGCLDLCRDPTGEAPSGDGGSCP